MTRKSGDWPVPKNIARAVYLVDIVVRLSLILVVLRYPLLGALLILLIDAADYEIAVSAGLTYIQYQLVDKTLDQINVLYLTISSFILDLPIKYLILGLFSYRLIGQIFFFLTHKEKHFVLFPNLVDFLFPLYLVTNSLALSLIISLPLKLIQEYMLHVRHYIDPFAMLFVRAHPEHGSRSS